MPVGVSECLFVGDNPRADVVGAHEAGMKVAWFQANQSQSWPEELTFRPVHVVSNAGGIIEIVSQAA
ncbi:MAG: HAD family hydrolase [Limnochordia bacterium]